MSLYKLVLRLVMRLVPTPSVALVIVLILLLSPRIRHKVGAVQPPSTERFDQPGRDTEGDVGDGDASWFLECDNAATVATAQQDEELELELDSEERPERSCRIPITVNYRSLETEFDIELNCTLPPSSSEYSRQMFRKVQSYRMSGRQVYAGEEGVGVGVGFGLAYLHYPENVRLLTLDGYCIGTVPVGSFRAFHRLDRLELIDSRVRCLPPGTFQGLATLKELRLIRTEFEWMNADALGQLEQLEQLTVHGSGTLNFTIRTLEALESFKLLDSRVTNLTALVETLPAALKRLQFVNVRSSSSSSAIERTAARIVIGGAAGLVKLTLVNCTLRYASIRDLAALLTLNLSQNALDERSLVLGGLPSLKLLVLSRNGLREVPAGLLTGATSLTTVDLAHNELTYLHPDAFGTAHAPSIVRLDLTGNQLLSLDYDIGDWPRLATIRADQNPWSCMWLRDSVLFERFEYTARDRLLSVSGLPCEMEPPPFAEPEPPSNITFGIMTTAPSDDDDDDHDVPDPEIILMHPRPKVTVTVPVEPPFRILTIVVVVTVGCLTSNVCLLLYNRYRRGQHVPFYRGTGACAVAASKRRGQQQRCCAGIVAACTSDADDGLDVAMTEKSTSFQYELPVECQPTCSYTTSAASNIYEEIVDVEPTPGARPVGYDVLQFEVHQDRYTVTGDIEPDPVYV